MFYDLLADSVWYYPWQIYNARGFNYNKLYAFV